MNAVGTWKITLASFPSGDDAFEKRQLNAIMVLSSYFSCSSSTGHCSQILVQ